MDRDAAVKSLIFDLDGTIYDLIIDWAALRAALTELGYGQAQIGAQIQAAIDSSDQLALELVTQFELAGVANGRPRPGSSELLPTLAMRYSIAIVSRNSEQAVARALERIGVCADFPIIGREGTTRLKPDPEALRSALVALDTEPGEAVMVGDTYHDVEMAKSLGVSVVTVHNPALQFSPPGADITVTSLFELLQILR